MWLIKPEEKLELRAPLSHRIFMPPSDNQTLLALPLAIQSLLSSYLLVYLQQGDVAHLQQPCLYSRHSADLWTVFPTSWEGHFNPSFPLTEPGQSWPSPLLTRLSTAKEITEVLKRWRQFWHQISVSYWLRPAVTCLRGRIWNLPSGFLFGSCKPILAQSRESCYYRLNSAWCCLRLFFL